MEGRKVLVVDDEQPIRDLLEEFLRGQGMEVATAADGRQALLCLDREDYDVLLTDLKMPGVDGLRLLERAGQMPAPPITVICTGHGSIDIVLHEK